MKRLLLSTLKPKSQTSKNNFKIKQMKKLKLLIALVVIALFSSCSSIYSGMMSGSAVLSENNFKVIETATGTSTAQSIFGFSDNKKEALVAEAKQDLLRSNPLKEGQALANVTVDFNVRTFLIIFTQKVTVTADIVEFR